MYRILVVDDEEEVRYALQRRLQREGYQVDLAEGEADGIEKIRQASPAYDVVITDMAMENPDSGVRILEAALAHDLFSEVIVLTAYGNVANAVECMRRGAFDYVEKNIPGVDVYELLVLKIEQALERRRSAVNTLRRMEEITRRLTTSTRRGD
ncbi:Transcriptional regulatory protein FixJ [bacterium HR16]|nr:Transcriptional regulatory protein FixJ [bacterium HR16]